MKTRDVFRVLRTHLESVASPQGFAPLKDARGLFLAWTRRLESGRHLSFWCQMNKSAWNNWTGSRFTVEFQEAETCEIGAGKGAKRTRIGPLLTAAELSELQDKQNAVIAKHRVPSAQELSEFMGFPIDENDFVFEQYRDACRPVDYSLREHNDIWFFVHDAQDVEQWGRYLADWLPGGIQRFAELEGEEFTW